MSGYMNKKHSRYPLIAKIGTALQVTEKCNTGTENLTMLCIQYKANAFGPDDSPMTDGNILKEPLKW